MSKAAEELDRIIAQENGPVAADRFADVVEEYIDFGGTADDYFTSLLRLPSPLLELYAVLIFNTTVGGDGLAFAIPRYENAGFMAALEKGLKLLEENELLELIQRARHHLGIGSSTALMSATPNVTFDSEVPEISNATFFAQRTQLMPKIAVYLKKNRDRVVAEAKQLESRSR